MTGLLCLFAVTTAGFVALGPGIGGMFTDSTQLAGDLRAASQAAGVGKGLCACSEQGCMSPHDSMGVPSTCCIAGNCALSQQCSGNLMSPNCRRAHLANADREESYAKEIRSFIADLKNYPGRAFAARRCNVVISMYSQGRCNIKGRHELTWGSLQ